MFKTREWEFLLEQAPRFPQIALEFCHAHDRDGQCSWYHGVWPWFRLLEAVATPWSQKSFYANSLEKVFCRLRHPRVLISGSADCAMLAIVLDVAHRVGVEPRITVVDRCATPLWLNQRYAEQMGVHLETRCCDLLGFTEKNRFDLIVTHSFLGNFAPESRPVLFQRWHDLLRSNGAVVTVNRIRTGCYDRQSFSPAAASAFIERLKQGAANFAGGLPFELDQLEWWGREYTRRYHSYPVASLDDLLALFDQAGLTIDTLENDGVAVDVSGPSAAGQALRLCVVASRHE